MPATELDLDMMRRALAAARAAADAGEVPVGAVVYRHDTGDVLAEAANRREADADPAAHAELLAIRQAAHTLGDWRLERCSLAVTLEPCPMCAGLIVNARLPRVLFGCADPKAGAAATLYTLLSDTRLNHRVAELIPGVLETDASALLKDFFRRLRATAAE